MYVHTHTHTQNIIAEGFGLVTMYHNIETNEMVAIKVNRPDPGTLHQAGEEIATLKKMCCQDPETSNILNGFSSTRNASV